MVLKKTYLIRRKVQNLEVNYKKYTYHIYINKIKLRKRKEDFHNLI